MSDVLLDLYPKLQRPWTVQSKHLVSISHPDTIVTLQLFFCLLHIPIPLPIPKTHKPFPNTNGVLSDGMKALIQIIFKLPTYPIMSNMFSSKSDYDRGINTFSPEGRIFQVQYAIEAIKLGSSAIGIKCAEGVVLAVERRLNSTLIVPESLEKIFEIDAHICCAASGVITDARTLIEHGRVEALNHRYTYLEPITVKALTQTISDLALNFGEGDPSSKKKPMSRPYGVALLIAGVDERGPCIYQTDPSGTMIEYKAKGIGAAEEGIQSLLNEKYNEKMSLEDAKKLALSSLKETMEEKISKNNVEVMVISNERKLVQRVTAEEIKRVLDKLQ